MYTTTATPYHYKRILGITQDEQDMLALALEYTMHQVRYDVERDRYFLAIDYPREINTVILPEELDVLEGIAFRVMTRLDREG
jgi:hypothetical protein